MKFGSVCSGIEAASVAWGDLGWSAAWVAEIEPFPSAVLAHHYPDVPNIGDMNNIAEMIDVGLIDAPDILCGGTPCQAFSVAGLRNSLDDARGNLSLTFCEIANAIDAARLIRGEPAAVIFWENVPGVLNTKDNAFGCFLAGLAGEDDPLIAPGGKWTNAGCVYGPKRTVAWRVLDAQYFGVAQRRRRVFVVASARTGFDPTAVLFEFDGVRRDTAPSRQTRESVAGTISSRTTGGGGLGPDFECSGGLRAVAGTLCVATGQAGAEIGADMAPTLNCNHEAPIVCGTLDQRIRTHSGQNDDGRFLVTQASPLPFDTTQLTSKANYSNPKAGDPCHPLAAQAHVPCIAFPERMSGTQCAAAENLAPSMGAANPTAELGDEVGNCLRASGGGGDKEHALVAMRVRRLTPGECEKLQGFPHGYTNIQHRGKPAADGNRYKALGNSWAVPNVRWIGERIANEVNFSRYFQ